jgi:hypothetical protein
MIRAKFVVESIKQDQWNRDARTVRLAPQYDTSIPEDQRFFNATPSGSMEMLINNPAVLKELTLGRKFYIDFTPVD